MEEGVADFEDFEVEGGDGEVFEGGGEAGRGDGGCDVGGCWGGHFVEGGGWDVVIAAIVFGNCWGRWDGRFEVFLDGRANKVIWLALTNVVRLS